MSLDANELDNLAQLERDEIATRARFEAGIVKVDLELCGGVSLRINGQPSEVASMGDISIDAVIPQDDMDALEKAFTKTRLAEAAFVAAHEQSRSALSKAESVLATTGAAPHLRPKVASVATERISASLLWHQLDTILSLENGSPSAEDAKALHEHVGGHHEDDAGEDAGEHAFPGCHANC